ncbi:MAG TPA: FAD-linked oxidase C-terminal domain-containing protein [Dokdonella sp.]|uniref:FAD-binding oxidoreductase n=1 Tax=Dokdonella sp. TaxID=2291710 RepID=UPI002D80520A|nr:FAD-linked oxidase C-terminal domain-containing protein [Dokdonella sp.]HET9034009.1 FAD-linked oxidase C-terminal domain-containing protein [Dokdonella sp.]
MALASPALSLLQTIFHGNALSTNAAECAVYAYDNSRREAIPEAVVFPSTHAQVVALVGVCRDHGIALTARGRGTNTTGASVPVNGGIVASFERMNRILDIDPDNRLAVVEPGVLNADLQTALKAHGFFWAPDPTSAPFCSIAGNIACNAGGPRAVKYGATRDNVLALRAVNGLGEEFRCGKPTTKGATGYDLTRLLIGSEGTLAIITEATLKLIPLASGKRTLRATYVDIAAAAAAVSRIMAQPVTPCALEYMDDEALRLARNHGGNAIPEAGSMLIIEVDGEPDALDSAIAAIRRAADGDGVIDLRVASDVDEVATLWAARKALSPALRTLAPNKINEDVVVPVSRVPQLIAGLKSISARHAIQIVTFGHAGNGNIHVNLLYQPEDPVQVANAPDCLSEVFDLVFALDGTLSGEHGIGMAKREFMPRALDAVSLELMRRIKRQFDPDGILNPGKLLPD